MTVRVEDRSPFLPVVVEPAWDSVSGRGLWMLRTMCRDFGCEPEAGGKAVWFVLDLDLGLDTGDADGGAAG
ncbi:ATP-binding protein [Streptomyces avicenniae]|uniref:ATP-binding protein n=1 Tax=Streptomyces avicenniae TaxID=500153 RepID=UPI00069BE54C|nr:ATP-binding protein [Streptomyces avicenniae]